MLADEGRLDVESHGLQHEGLIGSCLRHEEVATRASGIVRQLRKSFTGRYPCLSVPPFISKDEAHRQLENAEGYVRGRFLLLTLPASSFLPYRPSRRSSDKG
jgi:hypothetical protein